MMMTIDGWCTGPPPSTIGLTRGSGLGTRFYTGFRGRRTGFGARVHTISTSRTRDTRAFAHLRPNNSSVGMSAFSENSTRPAQEQQPFRSLHRLQLEALLPGKMETYVRQDGRRLSHARALQVHGSPDMRNILAGRDIGHQTSLSQKRLVKPQFEKMENGTFEKNLIEAEMHRGHYDANRFCAGSKDYRRMKHGPGWASRPASDKTQKDERIAASKSNVWEAPFFLSDGKKPEVRPGTDDMMRTLGWDQLADQERAGAPSASQTNGGTIFMFLVAQR